MKIKYDKRADAKYVTIKDGKVDHTKKINDWLLFDYAADGEVLGIEILRASKNQVGLFTNMGRFSGHSINPLKIMDKVKGDLVEASIVSQPTPLIPA